MKTVLCRSASWAAMLCVALPIISGTAHADVSGNVIRIGVMNDQSGHYADNCGQGSVVAAKLAVEDAGGAINGVPIEVVVADDQNKPDIGLATATRWVKDEGVDVIVGCSASSIALAVQEMMKVNEKPYLIAGSATSQLTNESCSPMTTQWVWDTYSMPKATVNSLLAQGKDTWFFITVDYTFGKQWMDDASRFIEQGGGKVVGSVKHPLGTTDFSSQLLQAQASGAKVIAFANAGADLANALKQAKEFGLDGSNPVLAPMGANISEVHANGLDTMRNIVLSTPVYWDANDETRALAKRFQTNFNGRIPNESQLSTYSAVKHYLDAVKATGTDDGKTVVKSMHDTPVNDQMMKDVPILANGQVMRPMYTARIKDPSEVRYPFDYYDIIATVPAENAWRPLAESKCPLVTN